MLLSPNLALSDVTQSTIRSRKSAVWKARQGQMKSVFDEGKKGKGKETLPKFSIPEFEAMSRLIIERIRTELDDQSVRALGADKVACPTLKVKLSVLLVFQFLTVVVVVARSRGRSRYVC